MIAWKPRVFSVNILQGSSQAMHCHVSPMSDLPALYCSFVYGFNDPPWVICGDMDCMMSDEERISAPIGRSEIEMITQCMQECNMVDVKVVGNMFTWNNKQQEEARVYSKIDKVMANRAWLALYFTTEVGFMNQGTFDHTLVLLTVY